MSDPATSILSDLTIYLKYAHYLPEVRRRETWLEIVARNRRMHERRYPALVQEIREVYRSVEAKQVLPSMRSLQFGGVAIERNPARMYNCSYHACDNWKVFSETMFLLLSGCGVGYSVQFQHVRELPVVRRTTRSKRFLIGDSIEGWADAVRALTKAYFFGTPKPVFDFSDIRRKGAPLRTSGGVAPGPEPLRRCLLQMDRLLSQVTPGDQLRPIQVHDLQCFVADAAQSGGVRESAMICLFSLDDEEMVAAKTGDWYATHPQRCRANNSAVILRHRVSRRDFHELWKRIELSRAGEPGVYFSNNSRWGTNPCCEIALRSQEFCNLTEINTSDVYRQEQINTRARIGAFLGTLQAGYTDFHYLRDGWRSTCEKEALLGVGMTGIASGGVLGLDQREAAEQVLSENAHLASVIGINAAARTTTIKPAGNSSAALGGITSGIHSWHASFFLRRIRLEKSQPLYHHLAAEHPELVEDDASAPSTRAMVVVPKRAPEGAPLRSEPALALLERVAQVSRDWVRTGHRSGDNTHNVSATVTVKDHEWKEVGEWMWENRSHYNGLAVLPYDGGTYVQPPFEEISEMEHARRVRTLRPVDLTAVREEADNTQLAREVACAGGRCEL